MFSIVDERLSVHELVDINEEGYWGECYDYVTDENIKINIKYYHDVFISVVEIYFNKRDRYYYLRDDLLKEEALMELNDIFSNESIIRKLISCD